MTIGAVSFQPYVYNTNRLSKASMNPISGISDDVLASKTDFSKLTSQDTTNPLKKGSSSNFMDILNSQMEMSRQNSARILKTNSSSETSQPEIPQIKIPQLDMDPQGEVVEPAIEQAAEMSNI